MTNSKTGKQNSVVMGLIIDEAEAAIIREIYHWYTVDLLTGYEIAKQLSERHIETPGESRGDKRKRISGAWRGETVYAILKNELYCGVWPYGKLDYYGVKHGTAKRKRRPDGEVIDVPVKAIVSKQTWENAEQRRKDGAGASKRRYLYLLSGRIKCGCGYAFSGRANPKGVRSYKCGGTAHRFNSVDVRICHEHSVKADLIEAIAWDFALQSKKSAAEFVAMLKEYQEQQQAERVPLAGQISEVMHLIETAKRRIKRSASLVGSVNDDDEAAQYQSDLDAAKSDKIGRERKLKKLEASDQWETTITDDDIIAVLAMREADIHKRQKATFEDRRHYPAKLDLRVELSNGKAKITAKVPVPEQLITLQSETELCVAPTRRLSLARE
jgi:hypothetical protein